MKEQDRRTDDLKVLGLGRRAEWPEIQAAYRTLAFELHPDRLRGDERPAQDFRTVNAAYERLRVRHAVERVRTRDHLERLCADPAAAHLTPEELVLRVRHSSSPQLRAASALLLAQQEGPAARTALLEASRDPDRQVRAAAIEGLKKIGNGWDRVRSLAEDRLRTIRRENR